jgi:diguanylate cyclase (GGDEF)-like protein
VSVVLFDCRGLKSINEGHGHHVGDQVLCRVAGTLGSTVRAGDLVARLGGHEFGVLLYDADEVTAANIVDRIEAEVESQRDLGQPETRLAIGVATCRDGDVESAQRRADAELLGAKRNARICVAAQRRTDTPP